MCFWLHFKVVFGRHDRPQRLFLDFTFNSVFLPLGFVIYLSELLKLHWWYSLFFSTSDLFSFLNFSSCLLATSLWLFAHCLKLNVICKVSFLFFGCVFIFLLLLMEFLASWNFVNWSSSLVQKCLRTLQFKLVYDCFYGLNLILTFYFSSFSFNFCAILAACITFKKTHTYACLFEVSLRILTAQSYLTFWKWCNHWENWDGTFLFLFWGGGAVVKRSCRSHRSIP